MEPLQLEGVIGASLAHGSTLHFLPGSRELVYPLGSSVVVQGGSSRGPPAFLTGHANQVTCVAVSRSGRWLASGSLTHPGFKAPVLLHDLAARQQAPARELELHSVKVQSVAFSCDEVYVATLGGEDDGNLAIWDLQTGVALAGSPASTGFARCLAFFHRSPHKLVTAGQSSLRIWEYDATIRKLHPTDVALGTITRNFTTLEVDPSDRVLYAGSSSGDVVQVNLERGILRNSGPAKSAISGGITALRLLPNESRLVCGGGCGTLSVLAVDSDLAADPKTLKKFSTVVSAQVSEHALTSIVLDAAAPASATGGGRTAFLVATAGSELFRVVLDLGAKSISKELLQTAHPGRINDVAFPQGYGEVCATAAKGEVRIWQLSTLTELLRMAVPGTDCRAVAFSADGRSCLSGWSDGKIRAWGPQSGKLLYTIHDAHLTGVTALAGTPDSTRVISGGEDGTVRVWRIGRESQVLEQGMKEHKAAINCIAVREDGSQCATASSDGATIFWDLRTCRRAAQLLENTFFKAVRFNPADASEVLTASTDKRVTYWNARSGEALLRIEATQGDSINCLALDSEGKLMVSGGSDKLVKVWGVEDGRCHAVGQAHSGSVTQARISFDRKHIVSVGADGALMVWRFPPPAAAP